jgi:hypothetical protein
LANLPSAIAWRICSSMPYMEQPCLWDEIHLAHPACSIPQGDGFSRLPDRLVQTPM